MAASKKSPSGNPGWLKWIVMAFLGYAVYLHFTGEKVGTIPPRESGKAGLTDASSSAKSLPDVTDTNIKVSGEVKGSGDEAQCGQAAVVKVSATYPDGKDYNGTAVSKDALTVQVGKSDKTHPWVGGLTGMSANGVREVLVPASYVLTEKEREDLVLDEKAQMRFRIHLESLSPTTEVDAIPMRVMDTVPSGGALAYCGDTVTFNLTLWGQEGKELYNNGKTPIVAELGSADVFYGLDRALLGMRDESVRTAIIPPSYATTRAEKKHPALKALPGGHVVIADIALISIEKPKK